MVTRPALNRLMAARLQVADVAVLRHIQGGDEAMQAAVIAAELMSIATLAIAALTEFEFECERRV